MKEVSVSEERERKVRKLTSLRESLGDDELRQVDLVLQEIRNDLLRVGFGTLNVALDEHLTQTGVDDGDDETAVVTTDGLRRRKGSDQERGRRGEERIHTSIPFVSILSYFSGFVQYSPA
jgi:hypothetical protein